MRTFDTQSPLTLKFEAAHKTHYFHAENTFIPAAVSILAVAVKEPRQMHHANELNSRHHADHFKTAFSNFSNCMARLHLMNAL